MLLDEFGLTLGDVAERVGKAKSTVSNRVRLLELPEDVLWMLARGELTERHARAVLAVPDREGQKKLAKRIVEQGLSAVAAERAAQDAGAKRKPRKKSAVDPALAGRVREAFERATGFKARVGPDQVVVEFRDEHELEELAEALENLTP